MLVRRFPYRTQLGVEQQLREIERLMQAVLGREGADEGSGSGGSSERQASSMMNPSTDVYRNDDELIIEMELPGVDVENDLHIDIDQGVLTIRGQRTSTRTSDDSGSYVTERRTGRFSRSLGLPDGVEPDNVEADYTDGVLTIHVPLPDQQEREPHRVKIGINDRRTRTIGTGTSDQNKDDQDRSDHETSGDETERSTSGSTEKSATKAPKKSSSRSAKKSSSGSTKKSSSGSAKETPSGSAKKTSSGSAKKASAKKSSAKGKSSDRESKAKADS